MQDIEQIGGDAAIVRIALDQLTGFVDQRPGILIDDGLEQADQEIPRDHAQHGLDSGGSNLAAAVSDGLVEQTQGIAHAAVRGMGEQAQGVFIGFHAFLLQQGGQVLADLLRRHALEVELQAARQHRHRQLLRIGGGEQEFHMGRRLFQRLQQGIEAVLGEHVHLVDEIHLETAAAGRVLHIVEQFAHVVHAGARGGIDLDQIDAAALVDLDTGGALAAGLRADALLAVEGLGKDACDGRLADTAGAGEQIGMVQPLGIQSVDQGLQHMLLPHHLAEVARSPLARKHLVAHRRDLEAVALQ